MIVNAVSDIIMQEENTYVYRTNLGDKDGNASYMEFLKFMMALPGGGISKVAYVYENSDYGTSMYNNQSTNVFPELGIEVVLAEPFTSGSGDLSGVVNKVKASGADELCQNLSGGNMQKVIVARELSVSPQLVIAVDIGASEYIHSMLLKTRDEGNAVLLISADLDEVMKLSDRILVMFEGEKTGEMTGAEADEKKIGRLMFGKEKEEAV